MDYQNHHYCRSIIQPYIEFLGNLQNNGTLEVEGMSKVLPKPLA